MTEEQLEFVKKLDQAIMPDGSVYKAEKKSAISKTDSTEKRRATASGLAASLARIKDSDGED